MRNLSLGKGGKEGKVVKHKSIALKIKAAIIKL